MSSAVVTRGFGHVIALVVTRGYAVHEATAIRERFILPDGREIYATRQEAEREVAEYLEAVARAEIRQERKKAGKKPIRRLTRKVVASRLPEAIEIRPVVTGQPILRLVREQILAELARRDDEARRAMEQDEEDTIIALLAA